MWQGFANSELLVQEPLLWILTEVIYKVLSLHTLKGLIEENSAFPENSTPFTLQNWPDIMCITALPVCTRGGILWRWPARSSPDQPIHLISSALLKWTKTNPVKSDRTLFSLFHLEFTQIHSNSKLLEFFECNNTCTLLMNLSSTIITKPSISTNILPNMVLMYWVQLWLLSWWTSKN